jgi:hypothetical protein
MMNADFTKWAQELAEDTEVVVTVNCVCGHEDARHFDHYRPRCECTVCGCMTYRPPQQVSVTVTVGWLLILAFLCLFWGAVIWGLLHMAGEL